MIEGKCEMETWREREAQAWEALTQEIERYVRLHWRAAVEERGWVDDVSNDLALITEVAVSRLRAEVARAERENAGVL